MRGRRGFNLFELLVVMVMLAILAGIALPRYGRALARYRALSAAQRIAADLALAQASARATSSQQSVTFDAARNLYQLSSGRHLDRAAVYEVNLAAEPYSSRIVSLSLGAGPSVTFDGYGNPGPLPNGGGRIVLQSGDEQVSVSIDPAQGKATVKR